MNKLLKLVTALLLSIAVISCKQQTMEQVGDLKSLETYTVLADTIITDVVIKNPNEDEWTDYTLRHLDKKALVNDIFDAVYTKKLIPYDFFKNIPITIDQVKEIESDPDFSRDKIGKVQFEEKWYFDAKNNTMIKKVHSIMLAYELINAEGEIKGYKPAFKVYLK